MSLFLLLITGISLYSEKVLATEPQTIRAVQVRERNLMDSLDQVFRTDKDTVAQHDEALQSVLSDMKICPYTDSVIDTLTDTFLSDCSELINKARGEQNLSYFLLKKAIQEGDFVEKRKQNLQDLLVETKDIVLDCECNEKITFTLRHKYDTPKKEQERLGLEGCSKRGYTNTSLNVVCGHNRNIEQQEEESLASIQSQLESCTYGKDTDSGSDEFTCSGFIEEAKKEGLSYFQLRYAIQKVVEKMKPSVEESVNPEEETTESKP